MGRGKGKEEQAMLEDVDWLVIEAEIRMRNKGIGL